MVKVSPAPDDFHAQTIRARSGSVDTTDKLVVFLYMLLRDHVLPGDIELIMKQIDKDPHTTATDPTKQEFLLSNGWIGQYAHDIAERLKT